MPETREDSVYLAKLAEQAERYEGAHARSMHARLLTCGHRDGGEHEAGGVLGPGTHRRGAQPPQRRIQERHRCPSCILAHRVVHRAERGVKGQRGPGRHDQGLPREDRVRTRKNLRGHPRRPRQAPHPLRCHWRVQGLLPQDVRRRLICGGSAHTLI